MIAPRLDDVLGHVPTRAFLKGCVAQDRVPHAMLFSGPGGVGKLTTALAFARELVCQGDAEEEARFDRFAHDRFVLYEDLADTVAVARAELIPMAGSEAELLKEYAKLEKEGWIHGVSRARGEFVVDRIARNPDHFTGRKGIPFADVLQKELASLDRARATSPLTVEIARRLFSAGTSRAFYRRNLGIELINGKGDGAYFRTVNSLLSRSAGTGWRVAILNDAHRMTDAAENAFLKTLEEPPPNTLLILVTSESMSMLPTTVSRCSRVLFDALSAEQVTGYLRETQGMSAPDAAIVASLAEGSIGKALDLRDLDFVARRGFLTELLPAVAAGDLGRCMVLAGGHLGQAAASTSGNPRDALRQQATLLLELLTLSFRDLAILGVVPDVPARSGLDEAFVRDLAARRPPEDWEHLFARSEIALSDVQRSVEPRLAVEGLFADALPLGASR